jgi:NAD(P)-dependent dehydrogenase (short-subunit alcohol dehydrogenase family)
MGLGLAITKAYVAAGASVFMAARDRTKLERAAADVASSASGTQMVKSQVADVSNPLDVERLVAATLRAFPNLDILVNNAGVYGPKGPIEEVDWQAWADAVNVNLLGSVLMARNVLPHFKARRYGKIVQLSGGGATAPLPRISAYAASKAGIVRFSETLAEEVREYGIDVNAIAPGALNTRLLDEVLEAGPEHVGNDSYQRSIKQKAEGGTPLDAGANLAVFLASAASDGITGKLISAVWDPWRSLPMHLDDLARTDLYTLRRIVPRDRGLDW